MLDRSAEQELAQIMACSSINILVAFMFELLWMDWRMLNSCECSRQYLRWCSYLWLREGVVRSQIISEEAPG